MSDILEGLVGTVDESGNNADIVPRKEGHGWLVDGQVSFHEFLNYFDRDDLQEKDRDFSTLSGLIMEQTRHIPKVGESVLWNGFRLEVVDMDGVRIDKILVEKS